MADDFLYEINRVLEETYEKTVGHFGREGGSHLTPTWVLRGAADEIAELRAHVAKLSAGRVPIDMKDPKDGRAPNGWAYVYNSPFGEVVMFNNGCEVNGGKPIKALPYWFGSLPEQRPSPPAARLAGLEHGNRSLRKGLERMRKRAERAEQKARSVIRPGLSAAEIMALNRAVNACEVTLAWAEKQSDPATAPTIAVCKVDADTFRGLLERNAKGEGVAQ